MKFKLLTVTALTLAVSAFAHAQTDPFLFGLRANLPNTEKLRDVRIATLNAELGNLDRIERIVKVFGMVNVASGFNQTPAVIDGCSDLLVEVFGDAGQHTRSAVGLAELPFNIAVEIELIARLRH